MAVITLTTDFGMQDHYVACVKGVILQIAPNVRLIDITHAIKRQGVLEAAFVLDQTMRWFAPGTIHLVVVDPGVGTTRRLIAARMGGQVVIAPDNGLISIASRHHAVEQVRVLENRRLMLPLISSTFHCRDVMAPVAAHVANGVRFEELGPLTDHVAILARSQPKEAADGSVEGRVIYHDRFGNCITNIPAALITKLSARGRRLHVALRGSDVAAVRTTYADVPAGEATALVGSGGLLEIAVNGGDAAHQLDIALDEPIRLYCAAN